jgi:translation elongation factor EF-G
VVADDDEIMDTGGDGGEPPSPRSRQRSAADLISSQIYLRSVVSAFARRVCSRVLDGVLDYLPTPLDVGSIHATLSATRTRDYRASAGRRRAVLGPPSRSPHTRSSASLAVRVCTWRVDSGAGVNNATDRQPSGSSPDAR